MILDRCNHPWRKLTETWRRALLDRAVRDSEARHGKFDLILICIKLTALSGKRLLSMETGPVLSARRVFCFVSGT